MPDTLEFEIDDPARMEDIIGDLVDDIEREFNEMDFQPYFQEIIPDLMETHKGYFERSTDPVGEPWPPLSPFTVMLKGHDTILVDTTDLRESLATKTQNSVQRVTDAGPGASQLEFGTGLPYSEKHNLGEEGLPKRIHVGLNEQKLDEYAEQAADFVITVFGGR